MIHHYNQIISNFPISRLNDSVGQANLQIYAPFTGTVFCLILKTCTMKNKNEHKSSHTHSATTDHRSENKVSDTTRTGGSGLTKPRYPVLGEKAENYLREQANIGDMPDESEYSEKIEKIKKKNTKTRSRHK